MSQTDAIHLSATSMFIGENPISVSIKRPVSSSDGAGGTLISSDTTLAAQTMRLVGLGYQSSQTSRVSADGQVVVAQYSLISLPSADMLVGDYFIGSDGKKYEVIFVSDRPQWRKRGEVFRHA